MSKASKKRMCPALGREISAADCGGQRESHLKCPGDCAYNPFAAANYSQLLEIEERLDAKTMDELTAQPPNPATMQRAAASRPDANGTNAFFTWEIFFAQDAAGMTMAQRWEKSGWTELKNDERVLFHGKMQMRVALLEIHRIFPGRVEVVDLLSGEPVPLILLDRSLAGMASRFSTLLTWVYPLPHYWRICGTAVPLPDVAQLPAAEVIREIAGHLGGARKETELRRWLAEHFAQVSDALTAVALARRKRMFAGMDAKWGKAMYEVTATYAQCRDRLDEVRDIAPDDLAPEERQEGFAEARVWFDDRLKPGAPDGRAALGRVLLGQSRWRLETMGSEKLARLRQQFETQLGGSVRFVGERVDDLGARMSARDPEVDESLVPPRLLENPEQIVLTSSRMPAPTPDVSPEDVEREVARAGHQAFLNDKVPALGNRTPREAAHDSAWRPTLVQMMKQRVRSQDERALATGVTEGEDLNWMLRELGLDEIIFDAPPLRPPPVIDEGVEDDGYDEDGFPGPALGSRHLPPAGNRPPAPPLPAVELSWEEAQQRFDMALEPFETAEAAQDELHASGATLLEDLEPIAMTGMTESEFSFAIPFLFQTWFALVPPGCRAPEIDPLDFETAFLANLRALNNCLKAPSARRLETFFQNTGQPNVMLLLVHAFHESAPRAPKDIRPSPEAEPFILALLKTLVEQLDAALRKKDG